jgi:hypothetical protein
MGAGAQLGNLKLPIRVSHPLGEDAWLAWV